MNLFLIELKILLMFFSKKKKKEIKINELQINT